MPRQSHIKKIFLTEACWSGDRRRCRSSHGPRPDPLSGQRLHSAPPPLGAVSSFTAGDQKSV